MSYELEKHIIKQNKNSNFNGQLSSWSNSTSIIFPAQTWLGIRNTYGTFIFLVESITVAPPLFPHVPHHLVSTQPQAFLLGSNPRFSAPAICILILSPGWRTAAVADTAQGRPGPSRIQLVIALEQCAHAPGPPKPGPGSKSRR